MWRWEDVKMWGWEDVKMSRCEDVKMWMCEDDEKMWRWWEDVKMWGCECVKMMRKCEDEKMWRWEDVKMRRCEDVRMWRWEDVRMRRWETDPHYWKNPALRRSGGKKGNMTYIENIEKPWKATSQIQSTNCDFLGAQSSKRSKPSRSVSMLGRLSCSHSLAPRRRKDNHGAETAASIQLLWSSMVKNNWTIPTISDYIWLSTICNCYWQLSIILPVKLPGKKLWAQMRRHPRHTWHLQCWACQPQHNSSQMLRGSFCEAAQMGNFNEIEIKFMSMYQFIQCFSNVYHSLSWSCCCDCTWDCLVPQSAAAVATPTATGDS